MGLQEQTTGGVPVLRITLELLLLAGLVSDPRILTPNFKVLPFNRVEVEGAVDRVEHCDDGQTRATAIQDADEGVKVSVEFGSTGTGFVMPRFALERGEQLVGIVCGENPRLVLRSGDAVTDARVTKTGVARQSPYASLAQGIAVSRAVFVSGQVAVLGADVDGTAAVGFVDDKTRSMQWSRIEGVAGMVLSLYPGREKGSWIGIAASLGRGEGGGSTVFSLRVRAAGGFESKVLVAGLPLVESAGCGPGCLAYIDSPMGVGSTGPIKVVRSDGTKVNIPVVPPIPEWMVTSTTLVHTGEGLCVLDTTPDGFGCRGAEVTVVAREAEFIVGPATIGSGEGLRSLVLLVRSMATVAEKGSQVAIVPLEVKKP